MQRIGEERQRVGELGLIGRKDARLPPAVGYARERHRAADDLPERSNRGLEAGAIPGRIRRPRRSLGLSLTEGEVATQDGHARDLEGFRHRDQKRRFAISAGAVRQHHAVSTAGGGLVQAAAHVLRLERLGGRRR
jgi:hypothetical protein